VTSKKDQEQYWADKRMPYQYLSVVTMTEAFKEFEVGRELSAHLSTPLDKTSSHPAALVHKKFALSKWELFKACTAREILLIKRNRFLYIFRTCQVSVFKDPRYSRSFSNNASDGFLQQRSKSHHRKSMPLLVTRLSICQ